MSWFEKEAILLYNEIESFGQTSLSLNDIPNKVYEALMIIKDKINKDKTESFKR